VSKTKEDLKMKKYVSFVLLVAMLLSVTVAQDSLPLAMKSARAESAVATQAPTEEYDFKKFRWGASMEEVIEVEGTPGAEQDLDDYDVHMISYEAKAIGFDTLLTYSFCDEGLYSVMYLLAESHSNNSLYIDDYEKFKSALEKKYGKPLIDLEDWENDSKKNYYADNKGDALCYGYLNYSTYWLLDRTIIKMSMSADNYNIWTYVRYQSNDITPDAADLSDQI